MKRLASPCGGVDHLGAVALGLLQGLRRVAARRGQRLVGVGVGAVLQRRALLPRRLHLAEGVDHLGGGSARSKLTRTMFTPEPYSSSVAWIRSCTSWLMMPRSRLRIGDSSERETTSRIADSDDRLDGRGRVGEVEQELGGVAHVPDHLEGDVDDVLVAGQHQPGAGAADGARADLLGVLAGDLDDLVGDDRPGREVQARLADAVAAALAEGQLDRLLLGLHGVERHQQPDADAAPTAISISPRRPMPPPPAAAGGRGRRRCGRPPIRISQLLLPLADDLVDVGDRRLAARPAAAAAIAAAAAAAPGSAAAALVAAAASPGSAVVAVGHPPPLLSVSSSRRSGRGM